jgi:hypothetical protein
MRTLLLATLVIVLTGGGVRAQAMYMPPQAELPAYAPPDLEAYVPDAYALLPLTPWWGSADYLLWFFKDAPLSTPLVSSVPLGGIGGPALGPSVVLGGQDLQLRPQSGGRFTLGRWFGDEPVFGFEGSFLFTANQTTSRAVTSNGELGSPTLVIPFYDPTLPGEVSTPISIPGAYAGRATLTDTTRLLGWELTGVTNLASAASYSLSLLTGFRSLQLNEDLAFDTSSPSIVPPLDVFRTTDEFHTRNDFYGGQVGLRGEYIWGLVRLGGSAKVALGNMHQKVGANGMLLTNDFDGFGVVQEFHGGYFVQSSNIGQRSINRFAAIPEINVNLGFVLTRWARLRVGYSFLYVTSVARPGDQIDRTINPSQSPAISGNPSGALVGPARPALDLSSTNFWAQGLNVGLDISY